jgi:hypothetical protein
MKAKLVFKILWVGKPLTLVSFIVNLAVPMLLRALVKNHLLK